MVRRRFPLGRFAVVVVLALAPWSIAQSPSGNEGNGWISRDACVDARNSALVVQMMSGDTAARIRLWKHQSVVVEPSSSAMPIGKVPQGYFDYAIRFDPEKAPVQISSFGSSQQGKDELSERILHSVGVSCLGPEDAVVYLGFAINGSQRNYVFIGLRIGKHSVQPTMLGTSEYGILSIDPKDRDAFDIWDGGEEAAANGMGARARFHVTRFRWSARSEGSPILKGPTMYSRNVYPGEVLYRGFGSMRLGNPRIPIKEHGDNNP